MPAFIR